MKFFSIAAIAAFATLAVASPAGHKEMMKRADATPIATRTVSDHGKSYVEVLEAVPPAKTTTTVYNTITHTTTNALLELDTPLLSFLIDNIPLLSELISALLGGAPGAPPSPTGAAAYAASSAAFGQQQQSAPAPVVPFLQQQQSAPAAANSAAAGASSVANARPSSAAFF